MAKVAIVPASGQWPAEFAIVAADLAEILGTSALRIDHVGSTSVAALDAKDVIDVQVAVADLDEVAVACRQLGRAGYRVLVPAFDHSVPEVADDGRGVRKGFAAEPAGSRRIHVHVRVLGAPNFRYALLFRDYLRLHPAAAAAYGRYKHQAAQLLADDSETYAQLKDSVCDLVYLPAIDWAERTGWVAPGAEDVDQ